jgi:hypothetical protein
MGLSRCIRAVSEAQELSMSAARRKVVEASPRGIAIDRHMTLTFAVCRVVQHGGMAAERSFDRGGVELSQGATDRRLRSSLPPLPAERQPMGSTSPATITKIATSTMSAGDTASRPPSSVFDFGQQVNK